jgi:4-hydroxy-2-oxoheptanedioate aldolase
MAELPRLNGIIKALESGRPVFTCFQPAEINNAINIATSKYDGVVFEMEHQPYDLGGFRHALQYMLNRGQIVKGGTLAPQVTPLVRIPVNGIEKSQWLAKQVLDSGAFGIVWPHISSVDEAYSAISAMRYPRMKDRPDYHPAGLRGDGPHAAVRYWGVSQQEYYDRADVWPLNPKGELFAILQMEDMAGIEALDDILTKVKGIGAILIGEGDLSQELGYPRQYEHPEVLKWMKKVVDTCKKHGVPVGHPHVEAGNAERIIKEGYTFLMAAPQQTFGHLTKAHEIAGFKK